jgi:hypothetical protein
LEILDANAAAAAAAAAAVVVVAACISTISFEPRGSGRRSLAAAGVNGARSPIDDATHVVLVVQIVVERHELAHQEFRRVSTLEVIIIIIARVVALRRLLPIVIAISTGSRRRAR